MCFFDTVLKKRYADVCYKFWNQNACIPAFISAVFNERY